MNCHGWGYTNVRRRALMKSIRIPGGVHVGQPRGGGGAGCGRSPLETLRFNNLETVVER